MKKYKIVTAKNAWLDRFNKYWHTDFKIEALVFEGMIISRGVLISDAVTIEKAVRDFNEMVNFVHAITLVEVEK